MSRFNFDQLKPSVERTAEYVLYQLEGEPVLIVKPATEVNKPYFNKVLRRGQRTQQRLRSKAINASMIAESRDDDRRLYPEHILVGWKNVVDTSGEPVTFSNETAAEFVQALPDHIFDDLRLFAAEPENFTEIVPDEEAEKNSPGA